MEKEMATHPNILIWKIPRTEKPVGLQSKGHKESDVQKPQTPYCKSVLHCFLEEHEES